MVSPLKISTPRSDFITLPPLDEPGSVAAVLKEALAQSDIVPFRTEPFSPDTLKLWEPIAELMASPIRMGEDGVTGRKNDTLWFDVSYHPERQHTFRHANTAQPLHCDGAYDELPIEYVLFLSQIAAKQGGETLFVGAQQIAAHARAHDPELYELLTCMPVRFGKHDAPGKTTPILIETERGWEVNWNYYRVLCDDKPEIEALKERFADWLQTEFVEAGRCLELKLDDGEGAIFYDRRILHGRHAYAASKLGDRCIWKCGLA